jgi:NHL repeat
MGGMVSAARRLMLMMVVSLCAVAGGLVLAGAPALASSSYLFGKPFEGSTIGRPVGLAVDQATGRVYLADLIDGVDVFEASGVPATPAHLEGGSSTESYGVAVDNSSEPTAGDVYVTDIGTGAVDKYNASGSIVTTGGEPFLTGLLEPTGVAVDSAGNVYVAEFGAGTVSKYSSAGTPSPGTIISGLSQPKALAIDSEGNVYAATGEGAVEYKASTGFTEHYLIDAAGQTGVAVVTSGVLSGDVFADEGSQIAWYKPTGPGAWSLIEKFGSGHLTEGYGLGLAINHAIPTVYVSDFGGEITGKADIFIFIEDKPPSVKTEPATAVARTTATLNATVNPESPTTEAEYYFEYSTTPCDIATSACGTKTAERGPLTGTTATPVAAGLGDLTPGTTYHYWVVAVNETSGPEHGTEQTLTTQPEQHTTEPAGETQGETKTTSTSPAFPNLTAITPVAAPKTPTAPIKKRLTRAQQLAKALKACTRKPNKQRAICKRQARKRYKAKPNAKQTNRRGAR